MASLSAERYRAFPNKLVEYLVPVPAVAADLSTNDTLLWQIHITNTTAGALTVTLTDLQTTPRYVLASVSIAANTSYIVAWPEGLLCPNGVNWVASGAGLQAAIVGAYSAS